MLKDFSLRPWWIRCWFARKMVRRETRALEAMAGVEGVPALLATAGPLAFVMERLDAERLPRSDVAPPPEPYWPQCRAMIDAMHERGVAHGDLRRKNILIGVQDRRPYLIDFATAWVARPGGAFERFMVRRVRTVDRVTYARIKKGYASGGLDAEERAWLDCAPWYLKLGRFLKQNVYKWRKPRVWKRRLRKMRGKS